MASDSWKLKCRTRKFVSDMYTCREKFTYHYNLSLRQVYATCNQGNVVLDNLFCHQSELYIYHFPLVNECI